MKTRSPIGYHATVLAIALLGSVLGLVRAQALESAFRFRIPNDPSTLDWTRAHTPSERAFATNAMEGLVRLDADLNPQPQLAERWEVSPDQKTYTFYLKKDVQWSDGVALDAEQFRAAWNRAKGHGALSELASVKCTETLRLVATLRHPQASFLAGLSLPETFPIRPDLLKEFGSRWTDVQNLAVLGPYKPERWVPLRFLRLLKNPKYHSDLSDAPAMLELVVEPDERRASSFFAVGSTDVLCPAAASDLEKAKHAGLVTQSDFGYQILGLAFRVDRPWVGDLRVRKALSLALEPNWVQDAFLPGAIKGRPNFEKPRSSIEEAKAMLPGLKAPPKRLTLIVEKGSDREETAWKIARKWNEALGLRVDTSSLTAPEFKTAVKRGKYDFAIATLDSDVLDPAPYYDQVLAISAWKNGAYTQALERARFGVASDLRLKAYHQAESLLTRVDLVFLPLGHPKGTCILGRTVKALEPVGVGYGGVPLASHARVK